MSIVHCPGCSFRVRVPSDTTDETWLRCPACRAEYQYSEILSHEPPELEVISGPSPVAAIGASALSDMDTELEDDFAAEIDPESSEFQVLAEGETSTSATDDNAWTKYGSDSMMKVTDATGDDDDLFGDEIGPNADAEPSERKFLDFGDDGAAADDGMRADFQGFGHDDSAPMTFHADQPDSGPDGVPADGEEFVGFADASFEPIVGEKTIHDVSGVAAGMSGVPAFVPKRKKKSGMLPMMIGVAGGGLLGLLIAYYGILMWVMNLDPLKIAQKMPDWVPEAMIPEVLRKPMKPPGLPLAIADEPEEKDPNDPPMTPENGDPAAPTDPGTTPDVPPTDPTDPLAIPAVPTPDPLDPGVVPEKPVMPADPSDPFANPPPVKPAVDPNDPFGTEKPATPVKPVEPPAPKYPSMLTDAAMTAEELDAAITTATESLAALVAAPTDNRAKINAYRNLSRMAEVAGNLKSWGATPEQITARITALGKVYDEIRKHPDLPNDLGGLAGFWLTVKADKRNNGILLYGALGEYETVGALFKTPLTIAAKTDAEGKEIAPAQKVAIISEKQLVADPTGNLMVLGVIVDVPTKQIPEYLGENERVVWSSVFPAPAAAPMMEKKPEVVPPAPGLDDPFATPPASPATPEPTPTLPAADLPVPNPEPAVEPDPFK